MLVFESARVAQPGNWAHIPNQSGGLTKKERV